jgi:hypothetical protein
MLLVPAEDSPRLAFEAEDADGGGAEDEVFSEGSIGDPATSKNAQYVSVSKEGDGTVGGEGALDHSLGAGGDLFESFTVGDLILPDGPAGNLFANLGCGLAFEDAVVPLLQVGIDDSVGIETGEAASLLRTGARTGHDEIEGVIGEDRRQGGGLIASLIGEGYIGAAGMGAGEAPFGFAVTYKPDFVYGVRHKANDTRSNGPSGRGARPEW